MANPQPTDSHLRLAVVIQDELTLRDFTKRQYKIINLILRVSWACGKKCAVIPQYTKYFKACGIYKSDIKKELNMLIKNRVIFWEQNTNIFEFNKNFDEWLIPYHPDTEKSLIQELINFNLKSKQNTNLVSKTLTEFENNTNSVSEKSELTEAEKAGLEQETGKPITSIITSNYNTMSNKEKCTEILNYLNQQTGKEFKLIESNLNLIAKRLNEYSIDELKSMIDFKVNEWENDKKMSVYLRPLTLFNASKCAGYVAESKKNKTIRMSNCIDSDKHTVQTINDWDLEKAARGEL